MAVRTLPLTIACALAALLAHAGCGGDTPVAPLDREALLDPDACKTCHPVAYQEWSGSMHAYAADDPVFRAMNQRAQRETSGALGDFCVKCHAPMAVQDGDDHRRPQPGHAAAEDEGRDLLLLPRRRVGRGNAQQPADAGEGRQPVRSVLRSGAGHAAQGRSTRACSTARRWSRRRCAAAATTSRTCRARTSSARSRSGRGRCSRRRPTARAAPSCHMKSTMAAAVSTVSTKARRLHAARRSRPSTWRSRRSPRWRRSARRRRRCSTTLIQPTLCYNTLTQRMELTLENVTAGHSWPSGATPDRRAWIELTAYAGEQSVIYSSGGGGRVPARGLERSRPVADARLPVRRRGRGDEDVLGGDDDQPATRCPARSSRTSTTRRRSTDPTRKKQYPETGMLPMMPDHVTLKIHLQAIGDDVLADLVASQDLDPAIPARDRPLRAGRRGVVRLDAGDRDAAMNDPTTSAALLCVVKPITYRTNTCPRSATRTARRSRSRRRSGVRAVTVPIFHRGLRMRSSRPWRTAGSARGSPAMRSGARRRRVRRQPARGVRGRVAALSSLRRSRADAAAGCVRGRQRPRRARDRVVRRRDDARRCPTARSPTTGTRPSTSPIACDDTTEGGCTKEAAMEIDAPLLPDAHELIHAYTYLRSPRRPIPFLAEGMAEAIGCGYEAPLSAVVRRRRLAQAVVERPLGQRSTAWAACSCAT